MKMLNAYDSIISFGGNCAAASQLRMQGMRLFYLPFDWLSMEGLRTIEWLISVFENLLVIAEKITLDLPFIGGRYARSIGTYDFPHTDSEWDFLDNIALSGVKGKRLKGVDKLKYRIWKYFSKYFRDNGFGCLGFRF